MRWICVLAVVAWLAGCERAVDTGPVAVPTLVAHRGASARAPENTIAAFALAWELGADAIEGDFHLTADGVIVCHHDASMEATAGLNVAIAGSSWADLAELDVGAWMGPAWAEIQMPTLADVLATVPASGEVLIEIKCGPEIVPELLRVMDASGVDGSQMWVIGFDEAVIEAVEQARPSVQTMWLTDFEVHRGSWRPSADAVAETALRIGADGVDVRGNVDVVDRAFVERMHAAGLLVYVWTVNEASVARQLAACGVDGITTDRPGALRATW